MAHGAVAETQVERRAQRASEVLGRGVGLRSPNRNHMNDPGRPGSQRIFMEQSQIIRSSAKAALAFGAVALGAAAIGAFAIGGAAIGALAVSALSIRKLRLLEGKLKELQIERLTIGELEIKSKREY
jgi:hypothetical protein